MMIPQVSGYPDYDVFMIEQVPGPRRSKIVGRHMWTVPKTCRQILSLKRNIKIFVFKNNLFIKILLSKRNIFNGII